MTTIAPIATNTKPETPAYVCLPRQFVGYPPIAHSHTPTSEQKITSFECALLAALCALAYRKWESCIHPQALARGDEAIGEENVLADAYRRAFVEMRRKRRSMTGKKKAEITAAAPAPRREHTFDAALAYEREDERAHQARRKPRNPYRPFKRGESLRMAGSEKYRKTRLRLKREGPDNPIVVELSRNALLEIAGLVSTAASYSKLAVALDRLTSPIMLDDEEWPGLLTEWQDLPGRLRLAVHPAWIPVKRFARVPLPLPASPTALALYLFTYWIDMSPIARNAMTPWAIFARLGIARSRHLVDASKQFHRAIKAVNQHLDGLDAEMLREHDIPVWSDLDAELVDDGRGAYAVLLVAGLRQENRRVPVAIQEKKVAIERVPMDLLARSLHAEVQACLEQPRRRIRVGRPFFNMDEAYLDGVLDEY